MNHVMLALWAFVVSTVFAMGGVGSAIVLVPTMEWAGVAVMMAKSTGLLTNTLAMLSSTVRNVRYRKLDYGFSLPVMLASTVGGPLGAYSSGVFPKIIVDVVFMVFLVYSGTVLVFFHPTRRRVKGKTIEGVAVGGLAGFLGGLLGVGGGAIVSPSLMILGYGPKKVATTTALVVFSSSLAGFLTYAGMGGFSQSLAIWVVLPALAGGWMGSHLMHSKLSPEGVKRLLGGIIYIMAAKLLLSVIVTL